VHKKKNMISVCEKEQAVVIVAATQVLHPERLTNQTK
jgi:hypothetical protein